LTSREESRRPPERDYQAADRLTVPPLLLGDIVISIDTAQRQAFRLKQTCASRLRTLLIHGLLHLHGYDHERSPREARRMFARERELTAELEAISNRKITPSRARGSKARSGGRSA
jgi:rRNA maturation RNase YbeY